MVFSALTKQDRYVVLLNGLNGKLPDASKVRILQAPVKRAV